MESIKIIVYALLIAVLTSCSGVGCSEINSQTNDNRHTTIEEQTQIEDLKEPPKQIGKTAQKLEMMGLVNILSLDPEIVVEIVYATTDNFAEQILYEDLTEAYLLPEVAEKVVDAHRILQLTYPDYRFVIYDAARPMSVQRKMRDVAVAMRKGYYVSNPANGGGLHNYGAAVDISILDQNGIALPMGTPFDYFGTEANTDNEQSLFSEGKLTEEELANRLLLRGLMKGQGFRTITSEWWHFNYCSRKEAIEKYKLIDF